MMLEAISTVQSTMKKKKKGELNPTDKIDLDLGYVYHYMAERNGKGDMIRDLPWWSKLLTLAAERLDQTTTPNQNECTTYQSPHCSVKQSTQ